MYVCRFSTALATALPSIRIGMEKSSAPASTLHQRSINAPWSVNGAPLTLYTALYGSIKALLLASITLPSITLKTLEHA